jgi:large subunit ribosomal protein L3
MQVGLFAKKGGMSRLFDDSGTIIPVTIIQTGLCQVSQIKTRSTAGYNAVQVACDDGKIMDGKIPVKVHLMEGVKRGSKSLGEFSVPEPKEFELGQEIEVDIFSPGQKVRVTGRSIGKGFSGNQKRWGFSRGPMTHGSKNHRLPGSVGAGSTPGRVHPGKRIAGRLGGCTVTIKNIEVFLVNYRDNVLLLKGSLPGKKGTVLKIQPEKYYS